MDWTWVTSPSRPSTSEILVIERYLKENLSAFPRDSRLLILGSTAEYRDLAYRFGFHTTIVDYKPRNFSAIGEHYCRHPTMELDDQLYANLAGVTRLHMVDWRDIDLKEIGPFYLILGDLAINMVPGVDQQGLIQNISNGLDSEGISIQRVWVRDPSRYSKEVNDIESIIASHVDDSKQCQGNHFYWLALPLISLFHDEKIGGTPFQDILRDLRRLRNNGTITEKLFHSFEAPWKHYEMPNYLPLRDDLDKMFTSLGLDFEVRQGEDPFSDMCPIYFTRG